VRTLGAAEVLAFFDEAANVDATVGDGGGKTLRPEGGLELFYVDKEILDKGLSPMSCYQGILNHQIVRQNFLQRLYPS